MTFLVRLLFLQISISFICGAKVRVKTESNLPDGSPVIVGPCTSNPCLNNGHCTPTSQTNIGYFCQCSIGFYVTNCTETDVALTLELINVGNENVTNFTTAFETAARVDPMIQNPATYRAGKLNGPARKMDMPSVLFQYGGATTPERLHGHAIIGFLFVLVVVRHLKMNFLNPVGTVMVLIQ